MTFKDRLVQIERLVSVIERRSITAFLLLALLLLTRPGDVRAQMLPVGDVLEDYGRVLQLAGRAPAFSFMVRPVAMPYLLGSAIQAKGHPWADHLSSFEPAVTDSRLRAGVLTPGVKSYYNSTRPNGQNDGAVWQGRGSTIALSAGGYASYGPLSAVFRPLFVHTQNRAFELSPFPTHRIFSEYAYATIATQTSQYPVLKSTIDWPQRFGDEPISTFDLGQSYLRAGYRGIGAGLTSENLWWGPGIQTSIAMTNNAPGIRHLFVGTSRPVDVRIGQVEGRWLWGKLYESDYYDFEPANDERYITAIALSFSPSFVPGLSVGVTRSYLKGLGQSDVEPDDYFLVFQNVFKRTLATPDNPHGFDELDQMISVFGRWLLPESGFELYGEWGKGDHSWDLRDALLQLQHANGYTVGLQKVFDRSIDNWWRVNAEITKLEAPKSDVVRGIGGYFYEHTLVRQGYTNHGQILGAGIGPGSNSQYLGVDTFTRWGLAGGHIRRVVWNNDRYYRSGATNEAGHQVELIFGARGLVFLRGFELEGSLSFDRMLNKYYEVGQDETNVQLTLAVRRSIMGYR